MIKLRSGVDPGDTAAGAKVKQRQATFKEWLRQYVHGNQSGYVHVNIARSTPSHDVTEITDVKGAKSTSDSRLQQ